MCGLISVVTALSQTHSSHTTEEKRPSISTLKEHLFLLHTLIIKNTSELREVSRGGKGKRGKTKNVEEEEGEGIEKDSRGAKKKREQ